ncbi:DUF2309 domain-containing protein [Pseudoalteromonas sp. McH1-7]|uniref:YbcC family protein n=1 Tax=Pseudoalteromonas TaxID=53246 RepID=UPI0015924849|nr:MULTISPECIES: DUF2309 domain-containing protein [Pseudoalteromonas]MDW7549468.1 DUF2309 domain-containing protein [Pseudoalteromonas peptidolytica]NUZ10634.1 DUF2309 domain-containing protein [Pseudoalteromonas sp. McH1-7]USD29113.1 DUF2309 domain-containing protein [Pseudoalteromonas sp. SCSIO 43201]
MFNHSNNQSVLSAPQQQQLLDAEMRIAPTWPLDQLIAVNPFWGIKALSFDVAVSKMSALAQVNMLMPIDFYLEQWLQGAIAPAALQQAAEYYQVPRSNNELLNWLRQSRRKELPHWHTLADLFDRYRSEHKMPWQEEITHQISQFCAAHYQQVQPILKQTQGHKKLCVYRHWHETVSQDLGISIVMGEPGLVEYFKQLPTEPDTVIALTVETLGIESTAIADYAHMLLLDINGWASWVGYERWQANLTGSPTSDMRALLAIRMAWELVIWQYVSKRYPTMFSQISHHWNRQKQQLPKIIAEHKQALSPRLLFQRALELSYQTKLAQQFESKQAHESNANILQAIFCIDVRSEVIRRALEKQHLGIQTMGYAGFFGLPIDYRASDSGFERPQLPGLLKAPLKVTQIHEPQSLTTQRQHAGRWQSWSHSAAASFSMVESMGMSYFYKLLRKVFMLYPTAHPVDSHIGTTAWRLTQDEREISATEQAQLVAPILAGMGLTTFADTVLLVGHGAKTTNNLHDAGLQCGACGGQSGEVNVKVLAQLLNDVAVRNELIKLGVKIPVTTRFIAALHNTTTEQIVTYGELKPEISQWLKQASHLARIERSEALAINPDILSQQQLELQFSARTKDWSQVRPEWGLANNAGFIIAPRQTTQGLDLQGRVFLHEYDYQQDPELTKLTSILTAPMLVTNWINMQYNASVTDPGKYGSGNKVLHNVVGGRIGVFEGNGGDLRIGLPLQSVYNGEKWMHTPQRLSVIVQAPTSALEHVMAEHEVVKQLVENEWLYLISISPKCNVLKRFERGQWHRI